MRERLRDNEAGQRYEHVARTGRAFFADSALIDPTKPITPRDVSLIFNFHQAVSPTNPSNPWRLTREDRSIEKGQIADPSTFGNWEAPGGGLEHMVLASQAAGIVVTLLQGHLKNPDQSSDPWSIAARRQIQTIDPLHASAAAALHDEGREVTHLFYTTDLIGDRLLQRIGIRKDIRSILPDERVMQVPLDQSMDEYMQRMPAEAVIVRIADEFGKRRAGTNRILQLEDFDPNTQAQWAQNFLQRPHSGRATDEWARQRIGLHSANAGRYFEAMDTWIQGVSTLTLQDVAQKLNQELSPTLTEVAEKKD